MAVFRFQGNSVLAILWDSKIELKDIKSPTLAGLNPSSAFTGYVTIGKLLNVSESSFSPLYDGNDYVYLAGLL